ncbi:MAG: response regulator [Polyangiaceae bacterium]|nr:response regulator [Polyangiaceae bacterium]
MSSASSPAPSHTRVLVIDDNEGIHATLRSLLRSRGGHVHAEVRGVERELFGAAAGAAKPFEIAGAQCGEEGVAKTEQAVSDGQRFAIAFVDLCMPGWDGIETTEKLWATDPDLQVVLVTGSSDVPWAEIRQRVGFRDNFLVLKKPFEPVEVRQIAQALARKWDLNAAVAERIHELENRLLARNVELELLAEHLQREAAERARIEVELRLAQKLEAVGQLASGIAHEINTPIQYVSDSLHFLKNATSDMRGLIEAYRNERPRLEAVSTGAEALARLAEAEDAADLEYLDEALPQALQRVFEGVGQVAKLVRSMKEFAHPGQRELAPADLRRGIENTVTVARNEYKYVADLVLELEEIPPVTCNAGELNQVFLNLIVNAAHAIADRGEPEVRGTITIRTALDGEMVRVSIGDTGCGIPEAAQQRIFEPFFTTKEVGRGTGQGLAIARNIIEQHGGSIAFESQQGQGTTFHIRLPVNGAETP